MGVDRLRELPRSRNLVLAPAPVPSARTTRIQGLEAFAELLIDCEEDRTLRSVLVGMLPEGDRT
jgi:hypothetical protein